MTNNIFPFESEEYCYMIPEPMSDASLNEKLEKHFYSQDYHHDIFFYVYSNISKKIIAQGGGYQYKKNKKKVDGFGFSCNVDYLAELTP